MAKHCDIEVGSNWILPHPECPDGEKVTVKEMGLKTRAQCNSMNSAMHTEFPNVTELDGNVVVQNAAGREFRVKSGQLIPLAPEDCGVACDCD